MTKPKGKSTKASGRKTKPRLDAPIWQGVNRAAENIREQFRDGSLSRADTPEEYGGDQLEHGAEYVADRAEHTGKDMGNRVKDKASEKIRDRLSADRVRENPERAEETGADTASEPDIRQKPEMDAERAIKTKENYIRSETSEEADYVREKPSQRPDLNHAEEIHARNRTDMANISDKPAYTQSRAYQGGREFTEKQAEQRIKTRESVRQSSRRAAADTGAKTVKTAEHSSVKTASRTTAKTAEASVKTTERTVKTAQKSAEATAKAAKATAKTVQKTAEVAARAAKAAAQAAARAAQAAAKAMAAAFKAVVAAIKGLAAAIAAGGWVAVVIIVAVALVALLLCTAFGVFSANETADGSKPMTQAVTEIDTAFHSELEARIAELSAGEYDAIVVEYMGDIDGDSAYLNNWNDVLATYAVLLTTDETAATDVVTVTPEKLQKLHDIFFEMNAVEYASEVVVETVTTETDDGVEAENVSTLYVYVTVHSLDYRDAADLYRMTEDQIEVLQEMMSPEFAALYAELIGVDITGGADLTQIISNLPANAKGSEVVKAALTRLGAPYVMGAKGKSKFDCSGLVYWSIKQVDASLGDWMYTNAAGQAKYCYDRGLTVGESELLPGDLVFWQNLSCDGCGRWNEVHHTGIYIGDGKVIEASSGKGRVVIRDLWSSTNYPIFMFARPY